MLIVVSGGPGSGKTTLAHALAGEIGCPAVCRDEVKEGLVHAGAGEPAPGADEAVRAVFFEVLGVLVRAGVSVVAEAAFQDRLWPVPAAGQALGDPPPGQRRLHPA